MADHCIAPPAELAGLSRPRLHVVATTWLSILVAVLGSGCASSGPESQAQTDQRVEAARARSAESVQSSLVGGQRQISIPELDQFTYNYADRYYMVISSAVDAIKRDNPDPTQRRIAHQIKLNGVLSMNDIVSGDDPYAQIFDLVTAVTLESIVLIDENRAEEVFGDRAPGLIKAIHTMRVEAWELAAKVLTQEQLERLDYIILEWRRNHPEIDQVAYVKFDNFAGVRATGLLAEVKAGGGFLAPLSETSMVLKDWGRLTERAFWYSKRAPNIAAIQAEGAVNEILSTPEISAVLQTADQLGRTAESAPGILDAQRQALFAELDARQELLSDTLTDVRTIVAEADALGRTSSQLAIDLRETLTILSETLKLADEVGRRFGMDQPSAKPFDIQEYAAILARLNEVVTNAQKLTESVDQAARSPGWQKGVLSVANTVDDRMDRLFVRLCLVLVLIFVLGVTYRAVSLTLSRRLADGDKGKP